MSSQRWIYDPPPPPPPKKTVHENSKVYNSQRPSRGRDNFRGATRGNGGQHRNFGNGGNRPQQRFQNRNMAPQMGYHHSYVPTGNQQPVQVDPLPTPKSSIGFPLLSFARHYPPHPQQQQYYPCPPQQYP